MTKRCLDEGLLQAYMDGELAQERAAQTAAHVAACDACAAALAEAEAESAFFAAAFAAEDSLAVPTEALRARIGAAVAQLESSSEHGQRRADGWGFGGLLAALSGLFTFTPQRAAAFASLLAAVAAGVIYFAVIRPHGASDGGPRPSNEIASGGGAKQAPATGVVTPTPEDAAPRMTEHGEAVPAGVSAPPKGKAGVVNASYNGPRRVSGRVETAHHANTPGDGGPHPAGEQLLPGEKDYRAAIASLEQTIKIGGDASLKPSLRVEYERNLAILDSAIEQTRQVATRNPKDRDAVGFLMSAYQSKLDLMTKVADQAQVAALGR